MSPRTPLPRASSFRRDDVERLAPEQPPDIGESDFPRWHASRRVLRLIDRDLFQVAGQLRFQQPVNILLVQGHPERAYRCSSRTA